MVHAPVLPETAGGHSLSLYQRSGDDELLSLTTPFATAASQPVWPLLLRLLPMRRMAINWWNSRQNRQPQNASVFNGGFRLDVASTRSTSVGAPGHIHTGKVLEG